MGEADSSAAGIATVFDIQRFSVHDGPGIRTTVFFKGCPLRCRWCHNPESISAAPQYLVYRSKCVRCGLCPGPEIAGAHLGEAATREADGEYPPCPHGGRSVAGERRSVDELVEAALRDEPFYGENTAGRGGVTLSGGEPLQQWDAVYELSRRLRAEGIHVTLDTSAFASRSIIERIPDAFDLVIVDLKAVNPELHRRFTGVDNAPILDAIHFLASRMTERLWVSVPLIPGVQDSTEITRIETFIRRLGPGPKARITPYHQFGDAKYHALGLAPPEFDGSRPVPEPLWQSDPNVPVNLADRGRDDDEAGPAPAQRCRGYESRPF